MKSSTRGPLNSTLRSSAAASAGKSSASASAAKGAKSSSSTSSSTRGQRAANANNNNSNNNQSSPNVGGTGRGRGATRDRSGNAHGDRDRDRGAADRGNDRTGDQGSAAAKSQRQDGKPKEPLKDLTLDDVNPDFTAWQVPDLARYRRATKMHHPAPRPIRPPTAPGIQHMRLRLPASAQSLLPDSAGDMAMDIDTHPRPPPMLVSIQGLDAARALLRPTHQIDLAEYAMRHYYTAAKIPLLDAPPTSSTSASESAQLQQQQQHQQPPVMVHPRAEAETILYFVYSSRFNRHRTLQLPMADAALMIREVREGKFATTSSMPASAVAPGSSSLASAAAAAATGGPTTTTTSAAALRARQAAAGLSGAGPFSVGPAGPGQVGGTLVLRGAGSESERGQPGHGAVGSAAPGHGGRAQQHHPQVGSSRYAHAHPSAAAHGHQQQHHHLAQQQYQQQQHHVASGSAARGYAHHPQHPSQGYQHPHPHHPGHAQQHHPATTAGRGQHGRA